MEVGSFLPSGRGCQLLAGCEAVPEKYISADGLNGSKCLRSQLIKAFAVLDVDHVGEKREPY